MIEEVFKKNNFIGVTGSIGSGKSRVSRFLATALGYLHINADEIARDLMAPGKQGWQAVKKLNPKYIDDDGELNRVQLRHDIFSNPQVRKSVDELIHPLVREKIASIEAASSVPGSVVEVPLLFEAGWSDDFQCVVLVYANKGTCVERVMRRDSVDRSQAESSFLSQMAFDEKIQRADHVINNSGPWWDTQLQILHLIEIL